MGFTETAQNILLTEEFQRRKFTDPNEVLKFLQDKQYFKSLSDQLKETMVDAGICKSDSDLDQFINSLYQSLVQQDNEQTEEHKRKGKDGEYKPFSKNTIRDWLNGETYRIKDREDMIRICFALSLSFSQAVDLIDKCGHAYFNVRSPKDTAYVYCLLHKKDLKTAYSFIDYYNENSLKTDNDDKKVPLQTKLANQVNLSKSSTGNTTNWIKEQLANYVWENDESFRRFLVDNQNMFISYSKNALFEYNKLKNSIYFPVLRKLIREQQARYNVRLKEEIKHRSDTESFPITIDEIEVKATQRFVTNLGHFATLSSSLDLESRNLISFFEEANSILKMKATPPEGVAKGSVRPEDYIVHNNSLDVIDFLETNWKNNMEDSFVQNAMSIFLSRVIKPYEMFDYWLPCITVNSDDDDKVRYQRPMKKNYEGKENPLGNSVLYHFPKNADITGIEKTPEKYVENITLRKTIILFSYLKYISEAVKNINVGNAPSATFSVLDYIKQIDTILDKCQLGPLYLANEYDALIVISVEALQLFVPDEENENPLPMLQEVISRSFDDEEDNKYPFLPNKYT